MKKRFGITFGGLQQKIFILVLILLLIMIFAFGLLSFFWGKDFVDLITETRDEQQTAITNVSEDTMNKVIDSSMTKTNRLQAYIADDMFGDVKNDVLTLQSLAGNIFEHKEGYDRFPVGRPDPKNDGKLVAQLLCEEGVDCNSSELAGIAGNMADTMIAMCENSGKINNCYIGLADGTHITVHSTSSDKFDENGNIMPFPVRQRPWYLDAVRTGELCFSDVTTDHFSGNMCVTCSAPVYADGTLIGVVGIDLFLGSMSDYVRSSANNGGFVCIVSSSGKVVFAPENNELFRIETSETAEDLRNSDNRELADFVTEALAGDTELRTVSVGGKEYYMTGTPIPTVGWTVISVVDKEATLLPTTQMLSEYDRINEEASSKYLDGKTKSTHVILIIFFVIIIIGCISSISVSGRIAKPVESMTNDIVEGGKTGKLFEMKDLYRTSDEIEVLAESFDDLSKKTRQYIIDITNITKEKERIGTELELARRIQADMIPNVFPPFPERSEFEIYATMTPAKEIGGDFYDFFFIDEDHLALVIADVSGKGIPAALFMMISKILINNFALMGGSASPKDVLEKTNEMICRNNKEQMFVTVWMGVLEIPTGKITAVNAGHEYPFIKQPDGKFEIFKDKHGFVIGGMEGMIYHEYEFTLEKGGTLFLYTDGVPEATNADNQLFGTERLLETMNKCTESGTEALLDHIHKSVDEFVGDAPQFDDLTMLCITLNK